MPSAPVREPHLRRFRVEAETEAEAGAEDREGPEVAALVRPAPHPERFSLVERFDRWRDDPRARIAAIVVVALAAGLFWYRSALADAPAAGDARAAGDPATAEAGTTPTTTVPATEVVVHVSGAVVRPGLLRLPPGARVADALDEAGGPLAGADLDQLNLASRLGDGERVHVPVEGEVLPQAAAAGAPAAAGPLNVNTASVADLQNLPGVGPSIAEAIVSERAAHPFETIDDLLRVRGIGPSRLAELRPLVTV